MTEILVEIGELIAAGNNMRSAQQTYEGAIGDVRAAAEDLATKWEGDGQVAFVNDQGQAYEYYRSLSQLAVAIIEELGKTAERYRDHIAQLKAQM